MDKRKETILNTIIREYIKTGAPVGSSVLVEKYKLNISPATARNEMAALEEEGYIIQPHTSAGRVPTEKAYVKYISGIKGKKLGKTEENDLYIVLGKKDEQSFKDTAKTISTLAQNAVFWAFHRHNLYYTGISNLFQQPEFSQIEVVYDVSSVIDRMDEIINSIFDKVEDEPKAMIGADNPFGEFFGSIVTKYRHNDNIGLFGIVGPMRMDYEKNLAIMDFVLKNIQTK
jgi:heat-inducible transcriptional repressor